MATLSQITHVALGAVTLEAPRARTLLGLPPLPVVDWPDSDEVGVLHWKTRGRVAQRRPIV